MWVCYLHRLLNILPILNINFIKYKRTFPHQYKCDLLELTAMSKLFSNCVKFQVCGAAF